jgi:hypothetical protein
VFILGILGSIFKDWRVVLVLILMALGGFVVWKFKHIESQLAESKQALQIEQANNVTLRGNLDEAAKINHANSEIIDQLEAQKTASVAAVNDLNNAIKVTNQGVAAIKSKIDQVTEPPKKMSPYIVEALKGAQALQDAEDALTATPPPPAAEPPKAGALTDIKLFFSGPKSAAQPAATQPLVAQPAAQPAPTKKTVVVIPRAAP